MAFIKRPSEGDEPGGADSIDSGWAFTWVPSMLGTEPERSVGFIRVTWCGAPLTLLKTLAIFLSTR